MIDKAFQTWARERLIDLKKEFPKETKRVSNFAIVEMTRGAFEDFKCAFGTKLGNLKTYKVPIPGLDSEFSSEPHSVKEGKLILKQ